MTPDEVRALAPRIERVVCSLQEAEAAAAALRDYADLLDDVALAKSDWPMRRIRVLEQDLADLEARCAPLVEAGCWVWPHLSSNGYPYAKGGVWIHRLAWEMAHGQPIPEGLEIDHLCRNPACINPAHLEAVTPRVNTLRGTGPTAQNAAKETCPRGHPYDDENTYYLTGDKNGRHCRACRREDAAKMGKRPPNENDLAKLAQIEARFGSDSFRFKDALFLLGGSDDHLRVVFKRLLGAGLLTDCTPRSAAGRPKRYAIAHNALAAYRAGGGGS